MELKWMQVDWKSISKGRGFTVSCTSVNMLVNKADIANLDCESSLLAEFSMSFDNNVSEKGNNQVNTSAGDGFTI